MKRNDAEYIWVFDDEEPFFDKEGLNYPALPRTSSLKITLVLGSKYNQRNPTLHARFGDGENRTYKFQSISNGEAEVRLDLDVAGPATITVTCEDYKTAQLIESKRFEMVIEANLSIGNVEIPIGALVMATCITQRMGKLDRWNSVVDILRRQCYNAIHLTPMQILGSSKSSYSIADHLNLSPEISTSGSWEEFGEILNFWEKEYSIISFTDLVLNHMSADSAFLKDHPEAGYNEVNSPWLKGPIALDNAIKAFNKAVIEGKIKNASKSITTTEQLDNLVQAYQKECLDRFDFLQWFTIDVAANVMAFKASSTCQDVEIVSNPEELLWQEILKLLGTTANGIVLAPEALARVARDERQLKTLLNSVQQKLWQMKGEVYESCISSFRGTVEYERLKMKKGPADCTPWNSFVPWYFTPIRSSGEGLLHLANNGWVVGWDSSRDFAAAGANVYFRRSLIAWSDCVKLRYGMSPSDSPALWNLMTNYCELIAKHFHGARLDNCHSTPIHVGKYMLEKARKQNPSFVVFAELFTGKQEDDVVFEKTLGLDALVRESIQTSSPGDQSWHAVKFSSLRGFGTVPLNPIQYTANDEVKIPHKRAANIYYDCTHDNETLFQRNRVQDALACAAICSASGAATGSTLGYEVLSKTNPSVVADGKYYPVWPVCAETDDCLTGNRIQARRDGGVLVEWLGKAKDVTLMGQFDSWTNGIKLEEVSPDHWQCVLDTPTIGKFKVDGTWQIAKHLPIIKDACGIDNNVISPSIPASWAQDYPSTEDLSRSAGIVEARRILNKLHHLMASEGYDQIDIQHYSDDMVKISRFNSNTSDVYHFIVRSHWWKGSDRPPIGEVPVEGMVSKLLLCARMDIDEHLLHQNASEIAGATSCLKANRIPCVHYDSLRDITQVAFNQFPSGSVIVLQASINRYDATIPKRIEAIFQTRSLKIPHALTNYLLWSCESEEVDRSQGHGVYQFSDTPTSVYAGFSGVVDALNTARKATKELAKKIPNVTFARTGIYDNVLNGQWLLDYHSQRFTRAINICANEEEETTVQTLQKLFDQCVRDVNSAHKSLKVACIDSLFAAFFRQFVKSYFSSTIQIASLKHITDPLIQKLSLAATQFCGVVPSSSLPYQGRYPVTTSAGLPFFSSGYMREWGRDTLIALPGLYLARGLYDHARITLIAYANVIRHAQIPNLLDSGVNPRYNARDATWFWLEGVKQYCKRSSEGVSFLDCKIEAIYDKNQGLAYETKTLTTIRDCVQHILGAHAKGITYREWNAGERIDSQMADEGFNVAIKLDPTTGFCLGGNRRNCGTWMDKMGSSIKAGNKGWPSTPRDGAPVELTCAAFSVLDWLVEDVIPAGDPIGSDLVYDNEHEIKTYAQWRDKIWENFDRCYRIVDEAKNPSHAIPGTYRDVYGCSVASEEYDLRCNYSYGFAMAPNIAPREHILEALRIAYRNLVGEHNQVGMKTLDPHHSSFIANYNNSDDGFDKRTAHGANYHQGPEWVWPLGAWYHAMWQQQPLAEDECYEFLVGLEPMRRWILNSVWHSIPELLDRNGALCVDSCQSQAWSVGTFLEFFTRMSGAKAKKAETVMPVEIVIENDVDLKEIDSNAEMSSDSSCMDSEESDAEEAICEEGMVAINTSSIATGINESEGGVGTKARQTSQSQRSSPRRRRKRLGRGRHSRTNRGISSR